jgi:glycerol-3-phosphate dehydrogenase
VREAVELDVAVFGGGIAGLWLLRRLRALGFNAALFEKNSLGTGQTIASQGIIHSGVKYTFDGVNRPQTEALSSMPKIWMDCIAGRGEVDLRGTQILAEHQLMFTTGGLLNRITGALATKALRSDVAIVDRANWPAVFDAREFSGKIYRLEEPVLATKMVLTALGKSNAHQAGVKSIQRTGDRVTEIIFNDAAETRIAPRTCLFTAGEGNEWFAEQIGLGKAKVAQRRPLRMFMARGLPHPLFAHCLVPEPKPRITVTTHALNGENVWYIGGNIAEKAVGMSDAEALHWAYSEMTDLFPWLNWKKVQWAIHDVDRAEPLANKLLPTGPTLTTAGNAALAWPTKLALAPALTLQALRWLEQQDVTPSHRTTALPLPTATPARYPWEEVREWRTL